MEYECKREYGAMVEEAMRESEVAHVAYGF